jgi:glycine betaine/proline transport system substrate-binding protein
MKLQWLAGLLAGALCTAAAGAATRCEVERKIVFAGLDWESNAFHTAVAQRIVRDGFGCAVDTLPGATIPLLNGLARGEIQVVMEVWMSNPPPSWAEGVAAGKLVEVGTNFPDATQGWYVPRYLVEGQGAPAAGLKSVADLPRFKALFADPEEPTKGRFLNCPAGWQCEVFNGKKLAAYGLAGSYTDFRPGTGAALDAAVVSALTRKRPVLFYYWGPTWLLGHWGQDLVQLDEPAYDAAVWKAMSEAKDAKDVKTATAYPTVRVVIGARKDFLDSAPQLHRFLQRYRTSAQLVSEALAYMRQNTASADDAARRFLKVHEALWTQWVPSEVADRVKAKL